MDWRVVVAGAIAGAVGGAVGGAVTYWFGATALGPSAIWVGTVGGFISGAVSAWIREILRR
jgi:hypothetical protein